MVFEVYLDPCTVNSRKVLAGLDLLGTKYNLNFINYFEGQHKSPDYTKINPHQTVPCAKDGELIITESNAILQHAADMTAASTAYPRDRHARTDINRWLLWEASVWFQSCYIYLVEYVVKPLLNAQPDENVIEEQASRWNQLAAILDTQLGKTKYISGNDVSIADIAIAAPMHLHEAQRLPLDKHANLKRWMADIEKLPCWQKTQGAVDKALLPNKQQQQQQANGGAQQEVRSTLNYTKDMGDKLTELYFYEDPKSVNIHEPGDDAHEVSIKDGWSQADSFTVDANGFSVNKLIPKFADGWEDESAVKQHFYPEVVEFLKQAIGAKRVEVFDHTVRSKKNQTKKLTQETSRWKKMKKTSMLTDHRSIDTTQRAPVRLVHCDYTAESAPIRVKQLFPDEADQLLKRRVAFVNVWKPLKRVEEMPLTMCDVKSSPSTDFFKLYLRYRDRTGENYVMRYSPQHQWYYFPQMKEDHVILLKTYDSDASRAQFVGHTAFEDPTTKPDAPFRESVEIRTIAFF